MLAARRPHSFVFPVVLILCGGIIGAACGAAAPTSGASGAPTTSAAATATPAPTSAPSATPSAAPTSGPPAGFAYSDFSGGTPGAGSAVVTVRVGMHDGYDRFAVEFSGTIPAYTIKRQAGTTFTESPKGTSVSLAGTNGLLVTLQPVAGWTSYAGPTRLSQDFPFLVEARQVQNFEGVQQWALGVQGEPALRVTTLDAPSRLVIDVA